VTSLTSSLRQDARHAVRLWCHSPGLSLAILTSLTLSVGAATAVFTFFDGLLLRPLPVHAPHELYAVGPPTGASPDLNPRYFSLEFYKQLAETDPAFRDLFASSTVVSSGVQLSADGSAARIRAELVSGNYFRVLGISARLGRTISEEDERSFGTQPVVVLSDATWRRWFNRRADVVGQIVRLNGSQYTVIGVVGERFFGTRVGFAPDLWVPLSMTSQMAGDPKPGRNSNYIELMQRVTPPASSVALESALTAADRQWSLSTSTLPADAGASQAPTLRLLPGGRGLSLLRGQYAQPLVILLSAVVTLMLIACANIANLLLARGMTRQREMAIRLAQGATRLRLTRQLVTECLVLTITGGALGWWAATVMGRSLHTFLPGSAAMEQFSPSVRAFLFTAGIVTLAGLVFGLVPSRIAARLDLNQALRRDTVGQRFPFWHLDGQSVLSAMQVALSLVLVIAAALFARTLHNMRSVETGFQQEHLLLAALDPVKSGYTEGRARILYDELLTRLRAHASVRAAGLASYGSLSGVMAAGTRFLNTPMHAAGQALSSAVDATVYINYVTPGYFEATGMAVLRGRDFAAQDVSSSPRTAIINETAARYFFGSTDPLGQRIGQGRSGPTEIEVVGVVGDAKYLNLREQPRRIVYRPHAQAFQSLMTLHVRAVGDPADLVPTVRQEARALDPALPVFNVQTMRGRMDESLSQERLVATLAGTLSLLGTLLAVVGVYGVVNYGVTRRKRELAIRMAVGASRRQVVWSVLNRSLLIALAGLALGIPLVFVSTTIYRTFLFGVTAMEPTVVSASAVGVALLAIAAGCIAAHGASRLDPLVALRDE
jgi:macrolide transport system ATP-binding/permease protein